MTDFSENENQMIKYNADDTTTKVNENISFTSEVPSALTSYLKNIHNMPPVSDDYQNQLGKNISTKTDKLREVLSTFGFVVKEYIQLTGNVLAGSMNISDLLTPSSIKKMGANPVEARVALSRWNEKMMLFYQQYRNIFHSNQKNRDEALDAIRQESIKLLGEYPLSPDIYTGLVASLGELFMMPLQGKIHPDFMLRFSDNDRNFIEEKFFHDAEKISEIVNQSLSALRNLQEARGKMLEQNLRLVVTIAKNYTSRYQSTPINDIVQEGNLGLLRAIEKFDFNLGYKFSTYAIWWIKQNISRFLAEHSRIIRIPSHMIQTIFAMNSAEQQFILENGREPQIEELAMTLEMPIARINAIKKMARQPISLQAQMGNGNSGDPGTLEDILPDETGTGPSDLLAGEFMNEQLHYVLSLLTEREQNIIINRFGLFGHPPCTLAELSVKFEITRERIRQLEGKILLKLGTPEMLQFFDRKK